VPLPFFNKSAVFHIAPFDYLFLAMLLFPMCSPVFEIVFGVFFVFAIRVVGRAVALRCVGTDLLCIDDMISWPNLNPSFFITDINIHSFFHLSIKVVVNLLSWLLNINIISVTSIVNLITQNAFLFFGCIFFFDFELYVRLSSHWDQFSTHLGIMSSRFLFLHRGFVISNFCLVPFSSGYRRDSFHSIAN